MIKEGINKQKMTFREGSNSPGGVEVYEAHKTQTFFQHSNTNDMFCYVHWQYLCMVY